jgi:hypothetical protein
MKMLKQGNCFKPQIIIVTIYCWLRFIKFVYEILCNIVKSGSMNHSTFHFNCRIKCRFKKKFLFKWNNNSCKKTSSSEILTYFVSFNPLQHFTPDLLNIWHSRLLVLINLYIFFGNNDPFPCFKEEIYKHILSIYLNVGNVSDMHYTT